MKKKYINFIIPIFTCTIMLFSSFNISFAQEQKLNFDHEVNLKTESFVKEVKVKASKNVLMGLTKSGTLKDYVVNEYCFIPNAVKSGNTNLVNCTFKEGVALIDTGLEQLNLDNTRIEGDLIISCEKPVRINLTGDSYIKNLCLTSPVVITGVESPNANYSSKPMGIQNISLSSDYKNTSQLVVNFPVDTLESYAKNPKLLIMKPLNKLSVVSKPELVGEKNVKVITKANPNIVKQYVYDLKDINSKKGFNEQSDGTSYQALLDFFRENKTKYIKEPQFIVKNVTDESINLINNTVIENYNNYLSLDIKSLFTFIYDIPDSNYGIMKMYICYGDDDDKRPLNKKWIDEKYNDIKDLDNIQYIREVNKLIAQHIVYTNDINKNTVYDAIYKQNCLCEGYAKLGYEFLVRKFGPENTILIANKDHIWNMVKLRNKWYHIDFTFNDPTTPSDRDYYSEQYLLKSDDTISSYENRNPWTKNIYPKANSDYSLD